MMGEIITPKYVELTRIINKPLLLHLVGCLYYCISAAGSDKHQISYSVGLFVAGIYRACNAHSPYCHLWPARLYNTFPHYLIKGQDFRKKILYIKLVF
jgi:hypothetical protein